MSSEYSDAFDRSDEELGEIGTQANLEGDASLDQVDDYSHSVTEEIQNEDKLGKTMEIKMEESFK
jgi:hypothetical protein